MQKQLSLKSIYRQTKNTTAQVIYDNSCDDEGADQCLVKPSVDSILGKKRAMMTNLGANMVKKGKVQPPVI